MENCNGQPFCREQIGVNTTRLVLQPDPVGPERTPKCNAVSALKDVHSRIRIVKKKNEKGEKV